MCTVVLYNSIHDNLFITINNQKQVKYLSFVQMDELYIPTMECYIIMKMKESSLYTFIQLYLTKIVLTKEVRPEEYNMIPLK